MTWGKKHQRQIPPCCPFLRLPLDVMITREGSAQKPLDESWQYWLGAVEGVANQALKRSIA